MPQVTVGGGFTVVRVVVVAVIFMLIGVSYRHLLYVIAQFTHENVLIKQKAGFIIKNKKRLMDLALEMDPENSFAELQH
jgi:hypothetical protein